MLFIYDIKFEQYMHKLLVMWRMCKTEVCLNCNTDDGDVDDDADDEAIVFS